MLVDQGSRLEVKDTALIKIRIKIHRFQLVAWVSRTQAAAGVPVGSRSFRSLHPSISFLQPVGHQGTKSNQLETSAARFVLDLAYRIYP